jgi:hypothetical protein
MTGSRAPRPGSGRRASRRVVAALSLLGLLTSGAATAALLTTPATAAGLAPDPGTVTATTGTVPRPDHVVVVVMENKHRSSVLGTSSAQFIDDLATRGANMSQSYGVTHPSQGNYVALFAGDQHGVSNDNCPINLGDKENLGSQLEDAGLTFTGYSDSLPHTGYTGCASGQYRRKHNPWVDFSNLGPQVNQPFTAFPKPADYDQLPTVSFVSPDMCHDMHDCSVATGDQWLEDNLAAYADWAMTHNSLLVVTFDENSGGTVNQIPTVIVGQQVKPGLYPEQMNHYNLLRTLEEAYGLAPLRKAADVAPLESIWAEAGTPPPSTGITNGDFESELAGWVLSGSTYSSVKHHQQGARSARAGTTRPTRGDSILSQTITVPADRTRLDVWWKGHCSDGVDKAWATVVVKDNTAGSSSTPLAPTCAYTNAWQQVGVPVTPGSSYTVQLVNHDDGLVGTVNRTYFDNVTLS